MMKHLWAMASLVVAGPALAYDVPFDQHTDWAYTDSASPAALHYRPFHFQMEGGRTLTEKGASQDLSNGWNAGAGLTWYPSRYLPLGVRVDASYSEFDARSRLLEETSDALGVPVDKGRLRRWGGDVDGEIDIPLTPQVRLYLVAGVGWYKTQALYKQYQYEPLMLCGWWGCALGYGSSSVLVSRATGDWEFSRNAGLGLEFGMAPGASFFMEARYMRVGPSSARQDFIPIRFGLRF